MTGILIAGTSSDAGKSLVVAGLCRALTDRGVRVAPFKAQNMSNNSMVVASRASASASRASASASRASAIAPRASAGGFGEIGRAQWLQALAARVPPTTAMNPVLLKPGTDRRSFVVLRGQPGGVLEAGEYATGRRALATAAFDAYAELAQEFDLVVCEGAGSPAEINLRAGDYVNFGLAERFDLPVVVVGDIDRGGILASLFGTWAIVSDTDRARLAGYVINKFRGDVSVLEPGLVELTRRTGMRSLGVLPWLDDVWLDGEDALRVDRWVDTRPLKSPENASNSRSLRSPEPTTSRSLRSPEGLSKGRPQPPLSIAVVRLPRVSNATDVDALAAEPGLEVSVTTSPMAVATADLVILPGSRSTVSDLAWLRERGLAEAVLDRVRRGRPVLGICGGYQMLCREIHDDLESGAGTVAGLGLIDGVVRFEHDKTLGLPAGDWCGHPVGGYEIHHGRVTLADKGEPFLDGTSDGVVWGTLWHGALEHDDFRRAWLTEIAARTGSPWRPQPGPGFADRREAMLDRLGRAVSDHLDLDTLVALTRPRA